MDPENGRLNSEGTQTMTGQRNWHLPTAVLMLFVGGLLVVWAVRSFGVKQTTPGDGQATTVADGRSAKRQGDGLPEAPPAGGGGAGAKQFGGAKQPGLVDLGGGSPKLPGGLSGATGKTASNADALPLHEASSRGDLEGLKAQLAKGVDVNIPLRGERAERQGMTPLMSAVISSGPETVKALLGAKADVHARTDDGFTALHFASERGVPGNTQALIEAIALTMPPSNLSKGVPSAGWGVDAVNKAGETPMMLAARSGSVEKVLALLGAGAGVQQRDQQGATALALASASNADALVVRVLLDAEADPNITDAQGVSPLMKAVERGSLPKVVALLNSGAVPMSKDAVGRTAFDRARARTDEAGGKIASVLTDAGDH
jgi:ankyrin repeat protein